MNQTLDGTLISTEITLVRVPCGDDYAVAGYSRDLREHKAMMADIERRDYLQSVMNDVSVIMLKSQIDDFASDLYRCMHMMGEALGMKPYGMQIDCVTNGEQAVEAVRRGSVIYDAIFIDHMMPGMDGIEATEEIRKIDTDYARSVPVIALTANAIVGNEAMFLSKGFQAFLSKPIDNGRLAEHRCTQRGNA